MNAQGLIHYSLHFLMPVLVAIIFYGKNRWQVSLIFLATMVVDLDHLLATPMFDPCRCSVRFHPLHSYVACAVYFAALFVPRLRVVAIGLLMHMITDGIDCVMSSMNPPCM